MTNTDHQISPRTSPLLGSFVLPGDKSISHRALFFSTLRPGIPVHNLSTGEDVKRTRRMIEAAGYSLTEEGDSLTIGPAPERPDALEHPVRIDCGNSGTTARLGLGWLTGERGLWKVTGDESLRARPMGRIIHPLESLGASFRGGREMLPVSVIAGEKIKGGGEFALASAQVHAGLTLAALRAAAPVTLLRTGPMRDHTLRLASQLQLPMTSDGSVDVVTPLQAHGGAGPDREGLPTSLTIPGDISSAAFLVAAALLIPGSRISITDVGLNPTRTAFLEAVRSLGADISWEVTADGWEPVGHIEVRGGNGLTGRDFSPETIDVAGMADELPLLAFIAAHAEGGSRISGAAELRVKESDRIAETVRILTGLGLVVAERPDGFDITGGGRVRGGVDVDPAGDHRLAMLGGIAGLVAEEPVCVRNARVASISWPDFWDRIQG